jgi:hypothetical protein
MSLHTFQQFNLKCSSHKKKPMNIGVFANVNVDPLILFYVQRLSFDA